MRWLQNLHLAETSKAQKMYLSSRRLTRLKSDVNVWQDFNSDDIYGSEVKYWQLTAVKRHCTNWYEIWALTDHEIYYIKIELDLRKFSNGPFSETEKGFWVNPTPGGSQCTGLSPTLSWKWPRATLSPSSGPFFARNHSFRVKMVSENV